MEYSVRQTTESDLEFVRVLHERSMRPHVETQHGKWDLEFQRRKFQHFSLIENLVVIEIEGTAVGCIGYELTDESLILDKIWLLPEYQNRGIGTKIIQSLIERAKKAGVPLNLEVLRVNPARNLYQKLGFQIFGRTDTTIQMHYIVAS